MSVIFLLIPLSLLIAAGFLLAFVWAVSSGQYEDTQTPSMRAVLDEPTLPAPNAREISESHYARAAGSSGPGSVTDVPSIYSNSNET